jgi:vanillate O-demethylase ferredoxin subunit
MNSTFDVVVRRKRQEAQDICSFELADALGRPLPAFSAGAHIDVQTPHGSVRQYSLCNDADESHRYLIAVLKDGNSRGGSRSMHENVSEGDRLVISAPRNHFPLAHAPSYSILLAGGIGITPILCMAERLARVGEGFELHYCTRSKDRTAFADHIRASTFASQVSFHFDDGPSGQRLDVGKLLANPAAGVHVYMCGPKGFMDAVMGAASSTGWPESQVHYEFFGAEPMKSDAESGFEVQLASSGRIVAVRADQTVIDALEAAGVSVATSCEQGVCGSCLTRVLEGIPDHRDVYLSAAEQAANDQFLPCCSRSKSARLVLDL